MASVWNGFLTGFGLVFGGIFVAIPVVFLLMKWAKWCGDKILKPLPAGSPASEKGDQANG